MNFLSKTVIILLTLFLFFTANAFALPITGGTVTMENDWTVPYTMTDNSDGTVYKSFCLESKNYFTPGVTYEVASVGEYAVGGGLGAGIYGDPVSDDTKWLYAAFISNVFQDVTNAALRVQEAIWFLEDEVDGIESSWIDLTSNYNFNDSGWTVVAVNLTLNGIDNQSQLVGTAPVPEPATMLLLGTGLVGLAGVRRKRMNK